MLALGYTGSSVPYGKLYIADIMSRSLKRVSRAALLAASLCCCGRVRQVTEPIATAALSLDGLQGSALSSASRLGWLISSIGGSGLIIPASVPPRGRLCNKRQVSAANFIRSVAVGSPSMAGAICCVLPRCKTPDFGQTKDSIRLRFRSEPRLPIVIGICLVRRVQDHGTIHEER